MSNRVRISGQTRKNWLIDFAVFAGGTTAFISSFYFLYFPTGREAAVVLFGRETWEDLHLYGGVAMIAAAAIHLAIHWNWVTSTAKRVYQNMRGSGGHLSGGSKLNIAVDTVVAISFTLAAITGIYFLYAPSGGYQGGRNLNWDPNFLFSRDAWDVIHTWSGSVLIGAAAVHFYLHWGWVKKVTIKFFAALLPERLTAQTIAVAGERQ